MKLSSVDLNLLLVLHEMLEDPSVSRAAKRLGVTPPAVSNALNRLRQLLDDPLFVRQGRGVVPTPRALELGPRVARAMAELQGVVAEDHSRPETTTRTLTLCLDDVSQVVHLPRLAASFRERMPRASLAIVSVDTLISRGGLEGGAADAAVAPAQATAGYASAPLFEVEGVLAVRKGHPCLRKRDRIAAINQLRHVDIHLALGGGGAGHEVAEEALSAAGVARDVAMVVPSFTAAAMVAAASDLVAGVPRSLVTALARTAPLTVVEAPSGGLRMQMHLVWHERTADDPIGAAFRELVVEALSDGTARARSNRAV